MRHGVEVTATNAVRRGSPDFVFVILSHQVVQLNQNRKNQKRQESRKAKNLCDANQKGMELLQEPFARIIVTIVQSLLSSDSIAIVKLILKRRNLLKIYLIY